MKRPAVEELFGRFARRTPHPETELLYDTPFQLLAAVLLSAQTTDVRVNAATRTLFAMAPTAAAMVDLGEEKIAHEIRTIGLYRNKARNLLATSAILATQHGGDVPDDRAVLESLPGVGRKTANVVLNTVFGHPVIAVDTHIFRVSNRMKLAPGETVEAVERRLMRVIPARWQQHAHHWLILHGRYTCKARKPLCGGCIAADLCPAFDPAMPGPTAESAARAPNL